MKKLAVLLGIFCLIQPITMASAAVNYQHDATTSFFGEYIEPSDEEDIPEPPKGVVAESPTAHPTANAVLPQTGATAQDEIIYQVVGSSLIGLLIYTYRKKKKEVFDYEEKINN
ncbi:LPXTG cell wall anchor domain-containing protein [Isobaculum melis]